MLISGNGNIGEVKNSIQDTIIVKEVDAQLQKRALSYYADAEQGMVKFDNSFSENAQDTLSYLIWLSNMPESSAFSDTAAYNAAVLAWQAAVPTMKTDVGNEFVAKITEWQQSVPSQESFSSTDEYMSALKIWKESTPATKENAIVLAYTAACNDVQAYAEQLASKLWYDKDSDEAMEILGSIMYALDPNGKFDEFYTENGEDAPDAYDYISLIEHIASGNIEEYISSAERASYRQKRACEGTAIFLAANMTNTESVELLMNALSAYGVTQEKYDSFGYTYASIKHMAKTAVLTYQGRLDYELSMIEDKYNSGEIAGESEYSAELEKKKQELASEISTSFLSTLPDAVSEALEEIGQADLYTLIVGSIFYKLAGLLLPIIYMIMASNNLIAGQVDSGSMAYVLSTSTKRSSVVFTQAVYLVGSLLAMFSLTTVTGCICLSIVSQEVDLTHGKLLLLNLGAFLVLLALSGLCFFTSCYFDRSKRSMAIGGGLSIFALVAAMLGLFGSPVILSVVRLEALNYFNYTTMISLFDVVSIMDGTNAFIWKFVILAVAGAVGYVLGALKFVKKDLPL